MADTANRTSWLVAIFLYVAVGGAAVQARGALVPTFETYFGVGKGLLGLVTPAGTIGFLAAMVAFGSASGRLDVRRFLLVSVALTGVSLLAMGASPTFLFLLGIIAVRSFATGIFRALDRPTLSHLYAESRARIFSLQEMTWAVGAMAGPILVTAVLTRYSWRVTYLVLAALTVPVFVLVWRLDAPPSISSEQSFERGDLRPLLTTPAIYGMVAALVFVGSIESVYFTWLPSYAETAFSGWITGLVLSIYLAAYIPGRLVFSYLSETFSFTRILLAASVLLTGLTYVTFVVADGYLLVPSIFVVGLLVSGLFPTLVSMGIESRPSFTGPVNVVANVAAQLGFLLAPAVVGVLADATSVGTAILVQIGLAGALAIVTLAMELGSTGTTATA